MAEYYGEVSDNFYAYSQQLFEEAIDIVDDDFHEDHIVALKFTGLIDVNAMERANEVSFKIEDFFEFNFDITHPDYGKAMSKSRFFERFPNFFQIQASEDELNEFWEALSPGQNEVYYFHYRTHFSFLNYLNPKIENTKVFKNLSFFSKEVLTELEKGMERIKSLLARAHSKPKNLFIVVDAEQSNF